MDKKLVKIFSGSSNLELSEKVAKNLKISLGEIEFQKFSDGETLPVWTALTIWKNCFCFFECAGIILYFLLIINIFELLNNMYFIDRNSIFLGVSSIYPFIFKISTIPNSIITINLHIFPLC